MPQPLQPHSERDKTDESLQVERDTVDRVFDDELSSAEEAADAVIRRARARADALLAAARAKSDRVSGIEPVSGALHTARADEDRVLQHERATADKALEDLRSENAAFLSSERLATDHDLSIERSRSDDALAMRDEFMGIVSHDLLNLLNAVLGTAVLIEKEVEREDHVERVAVHARRVQRSGARMARLVGDLVDVASIEAGMMSVARTVGDPTELVAEAVETFQAEAVKSGISLTADVRAGVPRVAFDAPRILQVLYNIITNALKFTPREGSVVLQLECVDGEVLWRVSDTGAGIPDGKLEAVFDRFVQLTLHDRRGVGLGLFIAKCIIRGHGGRIWVENRAGGGSTFSFTLPVSATAGEGRTGDPG